MSGPAPVLPRGGLEAPAVDPTPEQASFAADQLRSVLKMLGPGRATFYRDGSSIFHDQASRDEIRARIAHYDTIAGTRVPLIPEEDDEFVHCDRGPCGGRLNHEGTCS